MLGAPAERGQTTIAFAGILAFAILLIGGVATVAGAMVHRQRAQIAADAVALAAASDTATADALADWYRSRSIEVDYDAGRATASSGPARAAAWASTTVDVRDIAMPALVAILARAEQLTGETFASARVSSARIEIGIDEATRLRLVASELGLCERIDERSATHTTFGLC